MLSKFPRLFEAWPTGIGKAVWAVDVPKYRLNLDAIAATLQVLKSRFVPINEQLKAQRDPITDEVVDNLLAGYRYVDDALAEGVDLFALGNSRRVLELNTLTLCGTDPHLRARAAAHIAATERRFYEQRLGGYGDLVEWMALHTGGSVWSRAAGVYIRILSRPQLFIEGNHRTGVLIASHLMAREGQPPFVMSVDNAQAYLESCRVLRDTEKRSLTMIWRLPGLRRDLVGLFRDRSDPRHLRVGA